MAGEDGGVAARWALDVDPLLDGLVGPEPGPGGEGFFIVHGDGFCGEFDEELRDLGLHGVGSAVAVVVAVVVGGVVFLFPDG